MNDPLNPTAAAPKLEETISAPVEVVTNTRSVALEKLRPILEETRKAHADAQKHFASLHVLQLDVQKDWEKAWERLNKIDPRNHPFGEFDTALEVFNKVCSRKRAADQHEKQGAERLRNLSLDLATLERAAKILEQPLL